jgi:transposase-like protein
MAKYQKTHSHASRKKKKIFEVVQPSFSENRLYIEDLALAGLQPKIQQALEAERDEIVGRSWHEHHKAETPVQYRNGYGKARCLTCGSGTIAIQMPRLREPYDSKVVEKYERLTPAMQQHLSELYLHGLATGDFGPAFGWLWGDNAPLSPSSIGRLKQSWEEELSQWKKRPLEEEYLYVWADGIYPKGGAVDETLAILVVLGVNREGEKKLLAIEEGYRESQESWTDIFRDLKKRGVKWIGLIVGDGLDGLWKAARTVFPMARHQRCWVHKMRNILDKVPKNVHDEVLDRLRKIYRASSHAQAKQLKSEFIQQYCRLYPKAVKSLEEAGEMLFTYFRFPEKHWVHLKTTNPIESLFATVRLRTAAARRLRSRMSAVCLVFQILKTSEPRLRKIRSPWIVAETIDSLRLKKNSSITRRAA